MLVIHKRNHAKDSYGPLGIYSIKVPMKGKFFLRKSSKNRKTAVYRFSISYLVLALQSFEDAKIKAESTDTKHALLVTSHTLNKY